MPNIAVITYEIGIETSCFSMVSTKLKKNPEKLDMESRNLAGPLKNIARRCRITRGAESKSPRGMIDLNQAKFSE